MNPTWMLTMLVGLAAAFFWSANRRWQLLKVGRPENRLDQLGERVKGTYEYAFQQKKMHYYRLAGLAHQLIFVGFIVLLLRSLMLWGRGFDPTFNLWVLGPEPVRLFGAALPLGHFYEFLKDITASLVILGAAYFLYLRAFKHERRMTLSGEGILILGIILAMMFADLLYDGASTVLHARYATCADVDTQMCERIRTIVAPLGAAPEGAIGWRFFPNPAGSLAATILAKAGPENLIVFSHVGFWVHSTLVMVFLNLLPHSKHFHIITAIPNVFTRDLTPRGRLPYMGTTEEIMAKVEKAMEAMPDAPTIGVSRIEHYTWKAILDFYTCTECGRCSDNCPAHKTGKILSPKQFTLDLRDHLYRREDEFLNRSGGPKGAVDDAHGHAAHEHDHASGHGGHDPAAKEGEGFDEHGKDAHGHHDPTGHDDHGHGHDDHGHHEPVFPENPVPIPEVLSKPVDLVSDVIHPDVLWACTTCRACEEQCPVMISYVDKIVEMRRNLVMVRGEFPAELQGPFQAMEVNGNPWNLARIDRANWAEGLGIPTMAEYPDAPVLYWVGCAASYDDRAKKIARSTARLMKAAGVEFAILGQEETCTGDPARRAGNEYLFTMLAEQNVATLDGYKKQGGIKQIVTTCPHCFNTLANEYPDFGGRFEVVHHTDFLLGLVAEKKLIPRKKIEGKVVFHDSCYLGRYNDVYEQPRDILRSIPGVTLVEADGFSKKNGLCCGAGGAQMWMEEQNKDRMNVKRTLQLLKTEATTIATGCPFCQTMITDGLKDQNQEENIRQLDVVELLEESCALDRPIGVRAAMPQDPPRTAPSAREANAPPADAE